MSEAAKTFTYREAQALLPAVQRLTRSAVGQIEALFNQVQSRGEMTRRRQELEQAMDQIVERWAAEVADLGGEAKGLWLVDWDSGDGYYCWKFPEPTIGFFHSYNEGFEGRVPIN